MLNVAVALVGHSAAEGICSRVQLRKAQRDQGHPPASPKPPLSPADVQCLREQSDPAPPCPPKRLDLPDRGRGIGTVVARRNMSACLVFCSRIGCDTDQISRYSRNAYAQHYHCQELTLIGISSFDIVFSLNLRIFHFGVALRGCRLAVRAKLLRSVPVPPKCVGPLRHHVPVNHVVFLH